MWEILDINGVVLKSFDTQSEAEEYASCCIDEEYMIYYNPYREGE